MAEISDGRLVTGHAGGSVRLRRNFYDAPVELGTHVDAFHWGVTAVAVLSDGCVVTAGSDWRVRLWRTDQPGVPIEIGTHDGEVTAVAVLSDGSVVTGGRDGRVRLWRTDQRGVPMALSADDDDQMDKLVTTVYMLPDGHVVTYDVDGVIRLWRTDEPGVPLQVGTQDEDVSVWALSDGCVVTAVSLPVVSDRLTGWHRLAYAQASPASGSLVGRRVALASSGEALELPFVHARQPIFAVRGRWADPRVAGKPASRKACTYARSWSIRACN